MEKTVSGYGEQLQVYSINSLGQPKRGVPSPWELGWKLNTPDRDEISKL
jgi:hypothetical protein